ncbi:MAG: 16S rRNA (cytidine(1402)-2'-O)-methyltransferase [Gammaproteobacteria bacterium]
MSNAPGTLYIVATPIGNLGDWSQRAQEVLSQVSLIAVEDTRHSGKLLSHFGIQTPLLAYHEHNEQAAAEKILSRLRDGQSVALISDAGTPLISDPGYPLVSLALAEGLRVSPIPGPSAVVAALSASGLPTDRFVFEGFLPSKQQARLNRLEKLKADTRTLVFYESPHRIIDSLTDMQAVLGGERVAVLARELTKAYETIKQACLTDLQAWVAQDSNQSRGEIVLLVQGAVDTGPEDAEVERVLRILLKSLPIKEAAALAAEITGARKNALYKQALYIVGKNSGQ